MTELKPCPFCEALQTNKDIRVLFNKQLKADNMPIVYEDYTVALVVRYGLKDAESERVRCKDCLYWVAHDKRCVYLNHGFAPNMWCCHGRRADD